MKELKDEDLQRMLDDGHLPNDNNLPPALRKEVDTYNFLLNELRQQPAVKLPRNFAATVAAKVEAKSSRISILKFYLLALAVLSVSVTAAYLFLLQLNRSVAMHLTMVILPYKWMIIFIIFSLLAVQYIDHKFVREPKGMV